MKRIALAFIASALLIGCTSPEFGDSVDISSIDISPPSWAIGKWRDTYDGTVIIFTENNISLVSACGTIDFLNEYASSTFSQSIYAESGDQCYDILIIMNGVSVEYHFTFYPSNSKLYYYSGANGMFVGSFGGFTKY